MLKRLFEAGMFTLWTGVEGKVRLVSLWVQVVMPEG